MNAGVEKQVKLNEPIPVHIVYFTSWVDENGGLHFQPDVYGFDTNQAAAERQTRAKPLQLGAAPVRR
jgi:murein L,D-transpeptidase YcbB/YkuD